MKLNWLIGLAELPERLSSFVKRISFELVDWYWLVGLKMFKSRWYFFSNPYSARPFPIEASQSSPPRIAAVRTCACRIAASLMPVYSLPPAYSPAVTSGGHNGA